MSSTARRGFSLIELIVAMVIFGIVSASIYALLTRTQRLSRTQAERSIMQANLRTGLGLITAELRELNTNASQADIYALTSTSIEYRGLRSLGFICDKAAGFVRVPRATWYGFREPVPTRDRVLLFVDNDVRFDTDDGWLERGISEVTPENCSAGGAGIRLDFANNLPADTLDMITVGSPLRTFERMELGQVTTPDGEIWLGARSVSGGEGTLQPVLGPLAANGVRFTGWPGVAGSGPPTTTPTAVRTIRLTLRGLTENIVAAGAGTVAWQRATDSLVTDIRLRNVP